MLSPKEYLDNWDSETGGECLTSIKVRPDRLDIKRYGHHISSSDGANRHWRFVSKEGYAKFIADFQHELIIP